MRTAIILVRILFQVGNSFRILFRFLMDLILTLFWKLILLHEFYYRFRYKCEIKKSISSTYRQFNFVIVFIRIFTIFV